MTCESFINILFLDDNLHSEINEDVVSQMKIYNFPINIYGIEHLEKDDIINSIQCYKYNREDEKFDIGSKVTLKITDFQILFIDYELKAGITGSNIKSYLYDVEISRRPELVLLSKYQPGSKEIMDAGGQEISQSKDNKFDEYLWKGDNGCRLRKIIFQEIKKRYDITEFVALSPPETFEPGNTGDEKNIHLTDIFPKEIKITSRLWFSNKTGQVAYIYHNESGEQLLSEEDYSFFKNYKEGKKTLNTIVKDNCMKDMIQASFISKYDLGSFVDNYIVNWGKLEKRIYRSQYLTLCFFDDGHNLLVEEIEKMNEFLINEKSFVVQITSIISNGENCTLTIPVLLKCPVLHSENLYYSDNINDLIGILGDGSYINNIKSAELSGIARKINENYEYYKIEISVEKDTVGDIPKTLGDIYSYIKSIIKTELNPAISIFDLIGPSMVGPSSSHTCGANRIGRVARKIIKHYLESKDLTNKIILLSARLHDSFRKTGAGHKTLNAFAGGLLEDLKKDDKNPNVAKYAYSAWQNSKNDDKLIGGDKTINVKWLGYNNYETLSDKQYDIPLPPNFPETEDTRKKGQPDVHENAVAVLVKIVNNDEENNATIEFDNNWNSIDLVILGESTGGGKIQIKAIGGSQINKSDSLLKQWVCINNNGNTYYVYKPKNKEGKDILPLNGTTARTYPGINNIEDYPPQIKFPSINSNNKLTYAGLDDLKERINDENKKADPDSKKTLLDFAFAYEYWYLTGINMAIEESSEYKGNFRVAKKEIIEETERMLDTLIDSQYDFSKTEIPVRDETKNLITTYRRVKENNKDYLDAAVHAAITAMTKNALSMKILAAPTGGACGILPGAYAGIEKYYEEDEKRGQGKNTEDYVNALLISGFLAAISSNWVPPSGAALGCQAETGTGAAMGAAFACKLLGGTDTQSINAFCLALKNSMGLTCDPIAGRVNTPCIKRNGFKAVDALNAAFMSLKNLDSFIKADEILIAMKETGLDMQSKYRETSEGGLAKTASGLKEKFLNTQKYCC